MALTRRRTLYTVSLMAMSTLLAACETTTAPDLGLEFDTEATLAAYESMDSLFASPAMASFQALEGRTPFSASPAAATATAVMGRTSFADGGRAFALDLAKRLNRIDLSGGPAAAPIISDLHRGVTFVYDAQADEYTPDPTRDDAPATGVRLVLYEVDFLGHPVSTEEIGYADLVDEGDGSVEDIALHLRVVAYAATILDYRTTLDLLVSGATLGVHGFLQEPDGPRLDFDIEVAATETGSATTLDIGFELVVGTHDFSITGSVSGVEDATEGDGLVELTVRHGDDSIRLSVEGENGILDGSVFVNGSLFATVVGPESDPVITSATGDPLTFREFLVLRHIVDGVEDVFDFLEDLLDPVDELIVLAIIL